ncbi:MAG: hypothetical protein ACI89J_003153, partial [Hyphomicrobiaceae bacterium]
DHDGPERVRDPIGVLICGCIGELAAARCVFADNLPVIREAF